MGRPNLKIKTRTHTTRVLLDANRVVGVEAVERAVLGGGRRTKRYKSNNVICCAGAINTPQLLQISGIGPRAVLETAQTPVSVSYTHLTLPTKA